MKPAMTVRPKTSDLVPTLYLAFELSHKTWKLGFTTGFGQNPREKNSAARDLQALDVAIREARRCFELSDAAPVVSCYEAGRDAGSGSTGMLRPVALRTSWWIHRAWKWGVEHGRQRRTALMCESS